MKKRKQRSLPYAIFCILLSNIFIYLSNAAYAESEPKLKPHTCAEEWVIKQVTAGKIANLRERFADEADRVLSASFLETLLTSSLRDIEVHRHGVRISYAVIVEPVGLVNADIPHETWLDNCRFEDRVDLGGSLFRKFISLEGTSFKRQVNFSYMKASSGINFSKAFFKEDVDFRHMEVMGSALFDKAVFAGSVFFK